MTYRQALADYEEAQRRAEVRRQEFRWAVDRIRKTEAAILYAQAADDCEVARCRLDEVVMDELVKEIEPGGILGAAQAFGRTT